MAKAKEDGQLDFATKDIHDDKIELEIAKYLRQLVDNKEAAKKHGQATRELHKLLPIDEIEEPTRIKVGGGKEYGNLVVEITPRERDARNASPAGITKRIKITAL